MAGRASAQVRGGILGDQTRWLEQKLAEAQRLKAQAEASARRTVQTAARYGQQAVAQGRVIANDISRKVSNLAAPAPSPSRRPSAPRPAATRPAASQPKPPNVLRQAGDQTWAAVRGAQDAFTFGLGDRAWAGGGALVDAVHGKDLGDAYSQRMATERARDQYDDEHYKAARITGQVLGTGAQIAATGGLGGAALSGVRLAQGGARIAEATPLIARELAALGAAGVGVGVGGQALGDLSKGRLSSPGDYLGTGVGGVVGALGARTGKIGYAGAADGAITSFAQDIFNGRTPSVDRARNAALVGGAVGGAVGLVGRTASNAMARKAKEQLGEDFSRLRTWVRGDKTITTRKTREYLPDNKYTYPDQRTSREIVESKFGRRAELSDNQKAAAKTLSNYRVDHALPGDIGAIWGLPAASLGVADRDAYGPLSEEDVRAMFFGR